MERDFSKELEDSWSSIFNELEQMRLRLGGVDRAGNSGLDSVGRLNTSIFYGEDPDRWLYEAEECFSRSRFLSGREKVEAAVACFYGEAWVWFERIDRIRSVQTWEELKSLMLKKFLTSSMVDGEESGRVEDEGITGTLASQVHEMWGQNIGAEKTMNNFGEIVDYFGEVKESNEIDELKRIRFATLPEKKEKLSMNEPVELKKELPVPLLEVNRFFPSQGIVTGVENMAWRELEKKNEHIADKTKEVDTMDLIKGRRMRFVGLIPGLDHELGLQVTFIEETHVAKSGETGLMGSNPNNNWDPGISKAQHLEDQAKIQIVWVCYGPTPNGGPIKGSINYQFIQYFTDSVQIHPGVSRLYAPIQGTSPARLADYLGLDSSKFQNKLSEYISADSSSLLLCAFNGEGRHRGCEPLILSCPSCLSTVNCPPMVSSICALVSQKPGDTQARSADAAAEELTGGYVEMRRENSPGSSKKELIPSATGFHQQGPRKIVSLIGVSEALARIRFSVWVEKQDVVEAFRLLEVALQQAATDHSTGAGSTGLITTRVFAIERRRRENLVSITRNIIMEKMQLEDPSTRMLELLEELKKQSVGAVILLGELRYALATLASEGFVAIRGDGVKKKYESQVAKLSAQLKEGIGDGKEMAVNFISDLKIGAKVGLDQIKEMAQSNSGPDRIKSAYSPNIISHRFDPFQMQAHMFKFKQAQGKMGQNRSWDPGIQVAQPTHFLNCLKSWTRAILQFV